LRTASPDPEIVAGTLRSQAELLRLVEGEGLTFTIISIAALSDDARQPLRTAGAAARRGSLGEADLAAFSLASRMSHAIAISSRATVCPLRRQW